MAFMASTMLTFSPRQLFGAGEQGVWYDPADLSSLWQDAQGTTAVTAVEQAVGLILDRREGRGLGTELVTNNTFAADTDWTKGTGWSIGSGVATKTAGSAAVLSQAVTLTAGHTYRLVYTITRSAGSITPQFTGGSTVAGTARSAAGTFVEVLTAVSGNTTLEFSADASFAGTVDNVYLKRTSGNDAWQLTSASRPVLSARVNLLTKTQEFDDATWTVFQAVATNAISANQTTAPDGTSTADKLFAKAATGICEVYFTSGLGITSGVTYSLSFAVKKDTHRYVNVCFSHRTNTQNYVAAVFDLDGAGSTATQTSTGSISGTIVSTSQVSLGSGWYRLTITGSVTATTIDLIVGLAGAATGNTFNGSGFISRTWAGTESIFIWGADMRAANDSSGLIPAYQRVNTATDYDTIGFPRYLRFDGTDDSLATGGIDFSGTDAVTLAAGVRKLSDAARGTIAELTATIASNNGAFHLTAPNAASATYAFESKGTALTDAVAASGVAAPVTNVLCAYSDISSDQNILRVNGTQADSDAGDQGTGNFSNAILYVGSRGGSSLRFNGRLYSLIVRGASSTTGYITDTEGWINGRTRAYA